MTHPAVPFIAALFDPDDWVELRLILRRGTPGIQQWIKPNGLDGALNEIVARNAQGYNCYFGANPRKRPGGASGEDVSLARAVFADFDGGCSVECAAQRIRGSQLPDPSIMLHSGGGCHAYWLLEEPQHDLDQWSMAQRGVAALVDSDRTIHDPPRIMRLPGFANRKPGRDGVVAQVALFEPSRRWPFAEFPLAEKTTPPPATHTEIAADLEGEARRALKRMNAIKFEDGQDGSRRLLTCACIAVEHGLDDTTALGVIRSVSKPFPTDWSDQDITRRLRDAESKTSRGSAIRPTSKPTISITTNEPNNQRTDVTRNLTDLGNAERLIDAHGADLHYVKAWDQWLVWDGKRWLRDQTSEVMRMITGVIRNIYAECRREEDEERRKAIAKHAAASESRNRIEAAVSLARWQPGVSITAEQLDLGRNLINTQSGTFDVLTGELRPAARADLCTRITSAAFNSDAECPLFDSFLQTIFAGHLDLIDYLQRVFGYCATGYVGEQVLFMAHGSGRNGKTTLFDTIMHTLGDYAAKGSTDLLALKKNDEHPTQIASLQGKRLVVMSEVDDGMRWNEARMKELTGETRINARVMRGDPFDFEATHKLCIFGNSKPQIRGTDLGTWRRIRLIPFEHTIPEEEADPAYPDLLRAETDGIMRWILEGAARWHANGLRPPDEVVAATSEYQGESDTIGRFLDECCEFGHGKEVSANCIFKAYCEWCEDSGDRPATQTKFGRYLRARELGQAKDPGTRRKVWVGLGLRP